MIFLILIFRLICRLQTGLKFQIVILFPQTLPFQENVSHSYFGVVETVSACDLPTHPKWVAIMSDDLEGVYIHIYHIVVL